MGIYRLPLIMKTQKYQTQLALKATRAIAAAGGTALTTHPCLMTRLTMEATTSDTQHKFGTNEVVPWTTGTLCNYLLT